MYTDEDEVLTFEQHRTVSYYHHTEFLRAVNHDLEPVTLDLEVKVAIVKWGHLVHLVGKQTLIQPHHCKRRKVYQT